MKCHLRLLAALLGIGLLGPSARAQISLTTAVDLALRNSPKVRMSEADVDKARAGLSQSQDVYIPTLVGGSGLGYSYGFPLGQPTIFNFQAQSLVFSFSQRNYIRAARASLEAANLALMDVRQGVAEDATVTYIALQKDVDRRSALHDQQGFAQRLVRIVQQRLDAGQETPIALTSAQLTLAQLRLSLLHAESDFINDQTHLARMTGLPVSGVLPLKDSIPPVPTSSMPDSAQSPFVDPPSVQSAYANARARQQVAFGDARYLWRPQVGLGANYSRFSTFNNYAEYFGPRDPVTGNKLPFQYNAIGVGLQLSLPLLDMWRRAKAREAAADAAHAFHEADLARDTFRDGRVRLERSTDELVLRIDIAELDQKLAQQQLDVTLVQLNASSNPDGPQITPKDEQSARIAERERYISLLDARFAVQQASISFLRQSGALEVWLKGAAQMQSSPSAQPVPPLAPASTPAPIYP